MMSDGGRAWWRGPAIAAVTSVLAVTLVACTSSVTPNVTHEPRQEPGQAGSPDGGPAGGLASELAGRYEIAVESFARENGLEALPRARVRIDSQARSGAGASQTELAVLVASTRSARARGLQGVASIPRGVGMLFLLPEGSEREETGGFWMLGTLIPLDIAFVDDGVVVGVATMTPCVSRPCPITHPGLAFDMALEVAAGVLADVGLAPGDRLVVVG